MEAAAKYVGKKVLNDHVVDKYTPEDPYYETVEYQNKKGEKDFKQIKRQIPAGLSKNDERILKKARRRAWCLDLWFSMCGIRTGWTALIGFIPFVGDFINTYLGWCVISLCDQIDGGLPKTLSAQMYANVAIDFGLGFVPFVGSIAGAFYKSNSRNYMLLEHHLRKRAERNPISAENGGGTGGVMVGAKEYSGNHATGGPQAPQQAAVKEKKGWFGRSKKQPVQELPMSEVPNTQTAAVSGSHAATTGGTHTSPPGNAVDGNTTAQRHGQVQGSY